ncbi:hypothetical protein U9M48_044799 [Paspalum notatum var. saurae]|uniref:Uncharacterized protein n=1 Tax=Paspalum notatum var. saurae TaxID=547442 RepID=A0AAQ3V1U9_PASNO
MESSPAATATMAPPSSRPRDPPLLLGSFSLPSGWGCRRPMAFCREDTDAPEPAAATGAEDNGSRSPEKGAAAEAEEEAPRRQWNWNLRDRADRDYRAEDARPAKKLVGSAADGGGGGQRSRGFSLALTRQEIDADFVAITGRKPPRRPRKRAKSVLRQIEPLYPGSSLAEVTRDRYKVNEGQGVSSYLPVMA